MDPTSIVVELYRVSMVTYDLYLSMQDFSPTFRTLRLALEIERKRLELWAQAMGIDQGNAISERLQSDPALPEIIRAILTKMQERFDDSNKLLVEYQGAQSPPVGSEKDRKPDLTLNTSSGARKTFENYGRVVKWATRDKKKLEQLAKDLKEYNTDLDHLASDFEQASMRRSLRTQFLASNNLQELKLLQETTAITGHDELHHVANSKAFVKEVYRNEDISDSLKATQLKDVVHSDKEVLGSLESWKLDYPRLQYDGIGIINNQFRMLGTYRYRDGAREAVIVDWSQCEDISWRRRSPDAFHIRVASLARVLNVDLLPKGFQVLQCIGYLSASSTTIGYAFRVPSHVIPQTEPRPLYQILSDVKTAADIPELGTRFDLAKGIATTLFEFHNIGWLHKNIHPLESTR